MWKLLQLISNSWIIGFVFKVMRVGLLKRNYWSNQYVLLFFSIVSLGLDSHAAKAPWMSAVISFRDSKTIGWWEYVWKNELSSFSSALGTEKNLPDSNQGYTVLAARIQPLFRPSRQSQRRQSGLEHCHDGASSDRQSMIVSIWRLCAIKRLSESKRFFTWWHFLPNHLLKVVQIAPCLQQSPGYSWTHYITEKPGPFTEHCLCKLP